MRILYLISLVLCFSNISGQNVKYYAHEAVTDKYGIIMPWYQGENGQLDYRIRKTVEILKRYPWTSPGQAVTDAPYWLYSSYWNIDKDGNITKVLLGDTSTYSWTHGIPNNIWMYGDFGQRATNIIQSMSDYYRYSGDPLAIAYIKLIADFILENTLTDSTHEWPGFPISLPTRGKILGKFNEHGFIQLDLCAEIGTSVIRAYQFTGDKKYLDAAKHWADLFAAKCNYDTTQSPWFRYANPEDIPWKQDKLTGSIVMILNFMDEIIALGYTGADNNIVKARDYGQKYFQERVIKNWYKVDAWGHYYWDWPNPCKTVVAAWAAEYMIKNKNVFPNWKVDARNILGNSLNWVTSRYEHNYESADVFSGAWQTAESPICCDDAYSYPSQIYAPAFASYAYSCDNEWAREIARRMIILSTYDIKSTGAVIDGIDGHNITADSWFSIPHPFAMRHMLKIISWMPELFSPAGENHIVRTSSTVTNVNYSEKGISYTVFSPPIWTQTDNADVLRINFKPEKIYGDNEQLTELIGFSDLHNGYFYNSIGNGDYLLFIIHDGLKQIKITGKTNIEYVGCSQLYEGEILSPVNFSGNYAQVVGKVDPQGGKADVFVDGVKQADGIDRWNYLSIKDQIIYSINGLSDSSHEIKIVPKNEKNPLSKGNNIYIKGIQYSDIKTTSGYGEGGGPSDTQRMIFGYVKNEDYTDSKGNKWMPANGFLITTNDSAKLRRKNRYDLVRYFYFNERNKCPVENADEPELYRYGIHAPQITVYLTVNPAHKYYVKLKFADYPDTDSRLKSVSLSPVINVSVNDTMAVLDYNINETNNEDAVIAVDKVIKGITPVNGIIKINIKSTGSAGEEVLINAVECGVE